MTRPPPLSPLFPYTTLFRSGFSFFETAKPFAKEFMLRREGRLFRQLIFDKLTGRENGDGRIAWSRVRSEEHTSELQSQSNLVCRLLLEKKKKQSSELRECRA